jgi:RimJ/RimL family protein N-acetyltransferase
MKAQSQNNLAQDNASPGEPVDTLPARLPGDVTLQGRFGRIERLNAGRHGPALWEAIKGHDELWTYMRCGPFADETAFRKFMHERETRAGRVAYALLDKQGAVKGSFCLMEIRPADRIIEVGSVFYAPSVQRSAFGTEAQYLLMRYVFEELNYRRYEWKCNALNIKSRRAALRYGFTFEGVFRQDAIVKGRNRDTAWFSIIDKEWPAVKKNFERWLALENFYGNGKQKTPLAQVTCHPERSEGSPTHDPR